jgi:hypothetical protein
MNDKPVEKKDLIQQREELENRVAALEGALSSILLQATTCRMPVCTPAEVENARTLLKEMAIDPQAFAYTLMRGTVSAIADTSLKAQRPEVQKWIQNANAVQIPIKIVCTALRLAAGELSTHDPYTKMHPAEVYQKLINSASNPAVSKSAD